jgi:hypothetical protein
MEKRLSGGVFLANKVRLVSRRLHVRSVVEFEQKRLFRNVH